jgi:beta-glucanase (GH16 family)
MKRIFLLLFLLPHLTIAQTWRLVWQDEFTNGISPDWTFETGNGGDGWGNKELQFYQSKNATVINGELVITARMDSIGGFNYTSARMKTQGRQSWKYGKVEARIAMPCFKGIWPAFWMLGDNINAVGWPACGEIDIMEHINTENLTHGTLHWKNNNGQHASNGDTTAINVSDYHVYAIEWSPAVIKWLVDGVAFHEVNTKDIPAFRNNFYILLNMAVGGNWPGFTIDKNALPASMKVDYVRVFQ